MINQRALWKQVINKAHPILELPPPWFEGDRSDFSCQDDSVDEFRETPSLASMDWFFQITLVEKKVFQATFVEFIANQVRSRVPIIHWVDREDSFSFRVAEQQRRQIPRNLEEFGHFEVSFPEPSRVCDILWDVFGEIAIPGGTDTVNVILVRYYNDCDKQLYLETNKRYYYFKMESW